jgi:hypothetical protein
VWILDVTVNGIMNFTQYVDILAQKNLVASARRLKRGHKWIHKEMLNLATKIGIFAIAILVSRLETH